MKFIVVLDRNSVIGAAYADLCPPVQLGQQSHVGLFCKAADLSNPQYIAVQTLPMPQLESSQSLHIPHGNVLMVMEYDKGGQLPPGFV